jgi:hypothetical protein
MDDTVSAAVPRRRNQQKKRVGLDSSFLPSAFSSPLDPLRRCLRPPPAAMLTARVCSSCTRTFPARQSPEFLSRTSKSYRHQSSIPPSIYLAAPIFPHSLTEKEIVQIPLLASYNQQNQSPILSSRGRTPPQAVCKDEPNGTEEASIEILSDRRRIGRPCSGCRWCCRSRRCS